MVALTEKRGVRKEIAGVQHGNFEFVTFMQQFIFVVIHRLAEANLHFIHDSDSGFR